MKRAFDILASLAGLIILSPLLVVAALAVKLGSPGPIFFRQQRMGRNFRPFQILKFRSMVVDAPRLGAQVTSGDDPRITRIGRFLRQTKIDELPQLWNVLRGEMSLVGPRPEVPRYVEMFHDDYREILAVRPGVTDPASIRFRDEADILGRSPDPEKEYIERILPEKIALAKDYIGRSGFWYDLGVLGRTLWRVAH